MQRQILSIVILTVLPFAAAAEIKLSGEAAMGLSFSNDDIQAITRTKLTAHFSGVTDGGLEYGVILDIDPFAFDEPVGFGQDRPRGQVYISGGNHKLTIGQGDGAVKSLMGEQPRIGMR